MRFQKAYVSDAFDHHLGCSVRASLPNNQFALNARSFKLGSFWDREILIDPSLE